MNEKGKYIESVLDRLAASTQSPRGHFSAEAGRPLLAKRIAAWRRRRFLRIASSVAAVVLLGVLSWGMYLYVAPAEVLTVSTLAEIKEVSLPDGSSVTLNRYTTLSYPSKFKKQNREVELRGGGYFVVSKDKAHPFIVRTGEADIRVLGTAFDVEAYPKDELMKTALFEGSVALETEGGKRLVLVPGERAVYNRTANSLTKEEAVQPADAPTWQHGAFVFSELSLAEIARRLSNAFDVEIEIREPALKQQRMTGRFMYGESLDEILHLLQQVGEFEVTKENQKIELSVKN